MHVTVTKSPDGVSYMTKDGHGELFDSDVKLDEPAVRGDVSVLLVERGDATFVVFSMVDYLDTANREVPGKGVRHTWERQAPGRWDFGPYVVEASDG